MQVTVLTDLSRPVTAAGEAEMLERVRAAGGQVTTLENFLAEKDEWSRAKEIANFLIENAAARCGHQAVTLVSAAMLAITCRIVTA